MTFNKKSRFSKRVSGVMRKLFFKRRQEIVLPVYESPLVSRRRSMPMKNRQFLSESAVWRRNVEMLCKEYDEKAETATANIEHLDYLDYLGFQPNSSTLSNVRLQTRVYRDQLQDLKAEARLLKNQRDGLSYEMNNIRIEHQKVQQDVKRRKSIGAMRFNKII